MRFLDYWSTDIWPNIKDDFERLSQTKPKQQTDGAIGRPYGSKMYELLESQTRKEMRNVICNLCWTSPTGSSSLQENITLELVEKFVMDQFIKAVSAGNDLPAAASQSDGDEDTDEQAKHKAAVSAAAKAAEATQRDATVAKTRVWKVPECAPKFSNIPIALISIKTEAKKGRVPTNGHGLCGQWGVVGLPLGEAGWQHGRPGVFGEFYFGLALRLPILRG